MTSQRDVVLVSFPFSDLSQSKIRPAVVISSDFYNSKFTDAIVVPITSNLNERYFTILLTNKDLAQGSLLKESKIKVDRVFSVDKSLIKAVIGKVNNKIHKQIIELLNDLIR